MALSITKLGTSVGNTSTGPGYTWSATTPAGNAGIVVCAVNSATSAVPTPSISAPSWLSGSWTQELTDTTAGNYAMTVWSGKTVSSPGSDSITITPGGSPTGCIIIVVQITGQDTTDFLLQPEILFTSSSGTSETVTLNSALADTDSACLAFLAHNSNEVQNPTGGETELDDLGHNSPTRRLSAQYEINDTASSFSWASSASTYVAGMEIKAAAAAVTDLPPKMLILEFASTRAATY